MVQPDEKNTYDLVENFPEASHVFADYAYPVSTNNYGCFDKDFEKTDDYVLLLGDSFTWGYASYEDKWGTKLEKALNTEVLKCGVPGFGTKQALVKGQQVISKIGAPPKLIILGYFFNDLSDDHFFPQYTVIDGHLASLIKKSSFVKTEIERYGLEELEHRYHNYAQYGHPEYDQLDFGQRSLQRIRFFLKSHSISMRLLRRYIHLPTVEGHAPDLYAVDMEERGVQEAWIEHQANIREFINFAKEIQSEFLVVLIPSKGQVYSDAASDIKHQRVQKMLSDEGTQYVDLLELFRQHLHENKSGNDEKLYWDDDMHWNAQGNDLASLLISRYFTEHKLLEPE